LVLIVVKVVKASKAPVVLGVMTVSATLPM